MEQRKKLNEVIGVLLIAVGALLVLALGSYSSQDPSWNVSSPLESPLNLAGRVGAVTSDVLYQALGFPALAIPIPLLLVGYRRLRSREIPGLAWLKTVSVLILLGSLAGLLSLVSALLPQSNGFAPGGVLGSLLADLLLTYFNRPGSLLLVTALMVMALLAATRLSVDSLLQRYSGWRPRLAGLAGLKLWRGRGKRPAEELPQGEELPWDEDEEEGGKMPSLPEGDESGPEARPEVHLEEEFAASLKGGLGQMDAPKDPLAPEALPDLTVQLPSLEFLRAPDPGSEIDKERLYEKSGQLTAKYAEFGVHGKVRQIHPGPVVTTFEFKPDPGVKYSKVTSYEQDLCLGLKAESVRIDRIAGKNTVGVEVPNERRQTIYLREILATPGFHKAESPLTLALGKRINGSTFLANLAKMPHLLIAGSTGSGKSVGLNGMVCSILYKAQPSEVRFIMVDPKRLELGLYADIPHLLTPIVTDPKMASNALNWAVTEMEQRYKLLARHGVRNIAQFNQLMSERGKDSEGENEECTPLPYIVIIIDELADLMMTAGKDVEAALTRLAQMARAIGIHLILATQRPSVDVITGLIKANFPCRMSFRVSSRIDSRTIIDCQGAEQLLGMGDMLFLPPGTSRLVRLHAPFVSEKEISRITEFLRAQAEPQYQEEILVGEEEDDSGLVDVSDMHDDLYEEAARFVVETRKASTSLLQRRFRIGYGRAARLLDMMEHEGLISAPDGSKAREIMVPSNYFDEVQAEE